MANVRFIIDNSGDSSVLTVTAGSEDPNLTVDNLQQVSRSRVFRTTNTTAVEISGILSTATDISAMVLGRHNLAVGANYRLALYDDPTFVSPPIYDSGYIAIQAGEAGSDLWTWGTFLYGAIPWGADKNETEFNPRANVVMWLSSIYSASAFKIYINEGTSTSLSYFEIGRLFLGKYIEPTYNLSYGHSLSWEENTNQYRSDAGTLRSDIGLPIRRFEYDIGTVSETDRVLLQNAFRNSGLRRDLFISMFPDDIDIDRRVDYSAIVKLVKIPKFTEYQFKYYRSKYIMEEV